MTNDPDPLEVLREAWKAQRAAPPETLDGLDPETRATVGYLRDAFAVQAAQPPRALLAELEGRRKRASRKASLRVVRGGLALAAAASVLVALRSVWTSTDDPAAPSEPADDTPVLVASAEPSDVRHIARADYTPRNDGVELRAGTVRLILLTPEVTPEATYETVREDD